MLSVESSNIVLYLCKFKGIQNYLDMKKAPSRVLYLCKFKGIQNLKSSYIPFLHRFWLVFLLTIRCKPPVQIRTLHSYFRFTLSSQTDYSISVEEIHISSLILFSTQTSFSAAKLQTSDNFSSCTQIFLSETFQTLFYE